MGLTGYEYERTLSSVFFVSLTKADIVKFNMLLALLELSFHRFFYICTLLTPVLIGLFLKNRAC